MGKHDSPVSTMIVVEIAEREGVSPTALDPPLGAIVDMDALEAFVSGRETTPSAEQCVRLSYQGYTVTVRPGGHVVVE